MTTDTQSFQRLSDRILEALTMAIEQKDVAISEQLTRALEMSMTRNAGGLNFVERRDFSEAAEKAINDLDVLRKASTAS